MAPHRWDPIAPPVAGLVPPVPLDPDGLAGPTRGQSQGPRWRRTSPGRFVPAGTDSARVEQRIVEALVAAGPRAVLTCWAALRMHGGGHFDGLGRDGSTALPVPVATNGERVRTRVGLLVVRHTVPDDEIVTVHGLRCATPERALFDQMRLVGRHREMAAAADSAFAGRLTSLRRMRRYADSRYWYRDKRHVLAGLDMAVEGSRSPQEGRFRMIWEYDAGWGRPLVNRPLLDRDGVQLGIPDLFDPGRGVVGEYAGADHRDRDQHTVDIRREAAFRRVGLEYVEVTAADLRDPQLVVSRMKEAESRAGVLPQTWALGPPPRSLDSILDARDARGPVE